MKGVGVFLVVFLLMAVPGRGQCPSNKGQIDVAVSYGLLSVDQVAQKVTDDNNPGSKNITYNSGAPFVTVRYFLYNRLAIGFSCGTNSERWQYIDVYIPSTIISQSKQSATTVAFELYYIYVFRKYFEAYTLAGFGPSFTSTETVTNATTATSATTVNTTTAGVKVQYTPIGIRVGGKLGAFGELGIGYKGVFNFGVSYKFGPASWWKEEK